MAKAKPTATKGVRGKKKCPKCGELNSTRHTGSCANEKCDYTFKKATKKKNPYSGLKQEHFSLILLLANSYKKDPQFKVEKPKKPKPTAQDFRNADEKNRKTLNKEFDNWELYEQFKIIPSVQREEIKKAIS